MTESSGPSVPELISIFCYDAAETSPHPADASRPLVEIIQPPADETTIFSLGEAWEIIASIRDESCIKQVEIYVNNEVQDKEEIGALDPITWTVQGPPTGSYQIYIKAIDAAEHAELSEVAWIEVAP